jgi:DNA-directed RNA polymerase specialized sigma24 family protein
MNSSLRVWLSSARVDLGKVRAFISSRYSIGDQAAEDIVQTACLKMLSSKKRIRNPFAFLVQVSKNQALDLLDKQKVNARHQDSYLQYMETQRSGTEEPRIDPADYDDTPAYKFIAALLDGYTVTEMSFLFGESRQKIYRQVREVCEN